MLNYRKIYRSLHEGNINPLLHITEETTSDPEKGSPTFDAFYFVELKCFLKEQLKNLRSTIRSVEFVGWILLDFVHFEAPKKGWRTWEWPKKNAKRWRIQPMKVDDLPMNEDVPWFFVLDHQTILQRMTKTITISSPRGDSFLNWEPSCFENVWNPPDRNSVAGVHRMKNHPFTQNYDVNTVWVYYNISPTWIKAFHLKKEAITLPTWIKAIWGWFPAI